MAMLSRVSFESRHSSELGRSLLHWLMALGLPWLYFQRLYPPESVMRVRNMLFSAFVLLNLWLPCAYAERNLVDDVVLAADVVNAVFNRDERQVLDEYLHTDAYLGDHEREDDQNHVGKDKKKKKLPPGLKKKLERGGSLPPGWQKKVERGEVLDADVYRQARPIPERYLSRLEHEPGTSVLQVDDRIIRIHDATRTILDVFLPGQQ